MLQSALMNALMILNPTAGQGRPALAWPLVETALAGLVVETFVTQRQGDAERRVRRALSETDRFDAVLVAGGDGTLNEVIKGLLTDAQGQVWAEKASLPVGIVPLGTQNVLAQELKLPLKDLEAMAALLRAGKTRAIDLGRAGVRPFALMAGLGFDAAVVEEVVQPVKEWIGPAAYALATLGALAKMRSSCVRLVLDGEEITTEAFLVVVANAASYALRQIRVAPFASLEDGWLDVCVFEKPLLDKVGFVSQVVAVIARRHLRDPRVRYYRAKRIEIEATPPIQVQLDGDKFGQTPLVLESLPDALRVFVP